MNDMRKGMLLFILMFILLFLIMAPVARTQPNNNGVMRITVTGTKSESTVKDYAGSADIIDKEDYDISPSVDIRNLLIYGFHWFL